MAYNFGCCFPCCCCPNQNINTDAMVIQPDMTIINNFVNEPGAKAMLFQPIQTSMEKDTPVPLNMQFNSAGPKVKHYAGTPDIYLKNRQIRSFILCNIYINSNNNNSIANKTQ